MATQEKERNVSVEIANCARNALSYMTTNRMQLTPENYRRCYERFAGPTGASYDDSAIHAGMERALTDELKAIIVMLLDYLRGSMSLPLDEDHPLLNLETATRTINDPMEVAKLKEELRKTMTDLEQVAGAGAQARASAAADDLSHQLKEVVVMLLEQKRGSLAELPDETRPLIEMEQAIATATDPSQVARLRLDLQEAVERLDSRVSAAEIQRNNAFRKVVDTLVTSFKGQMEGDGAISEELAQHASQLEGIINDNPAGAGEVLGRLRTVAQGVRGSMDKFHERQEEATNRLIESQTEIQRLKDEIKKREKEAIFDELTNIANRRAFNQKMEEELARFERYNNTFSLVMFDIDHFKNFNDTYGHLVGDQVLETLAKVVSKALRKTDFFARYGGEEFVIIAGGTPLDKAAIVAEKVRSKVEDIKFLYENKPVPVTISLGVAQVAKGDNAAGLIKKADDCLYYAKGNGRNQVCSSIPEQSEQAEAEEEKAVVDD